MKDDNNTGTRKAVFVLGMHRSGTSATAGVLHYAGIDFGNRLLSGKPDNPKGFFEHEEIWNIHETLLNDLGSSWDDIRPLPLDWLGTEAAQSASARLGEIIDVEFSRLQVWGLKDPRLSRLFPLWFPILKERSITPLIVLAIRHPLEVAQSLHRRDKIGLSHGLALWLRYTLEAEQSSRNFRRIVQHYPSLISDWRAELENISNRLGLSCSELSASTQIRIDRFIDKDLRHEKSCQKMTNYSISTHLDDLCTKTYNQIKILNENSDTETLDEISSKLSYFEKNITHYSEISGLYIKFSIEKTKTISFFIENKASMEKEIDRIMALNVRTSEQLNYKINSLYKEIKYKNIEYENITKELENITIENQKIIQDIYQSTSWKITGPLRALKRLVSKVAP